MPDAAKNFAYTTVLTAPSPATTGTSLVVAAGTGTVFPAVPFNATVWPAGSQPLNGNAEIVRVTAVSTDTLTITRAQETSAAKAITAGYQIAATMSVKTLTDAYGAYRLETVVTPSSTPVDPWGSTNTNWAAALQVDAKPQALAGTYPFPTAITAGVTNAANTDYAYGLMGADLYSIHLGTKAPGSGDQISAMVGARMTASDFKWGGPGATGQVQSLFGSEHFAQHAGPNAVGSILGLSALVYAQKYLAASMPGAITNRVVGIDTEIYMDNNLGTVPLVRGVQILKGTSQPTTVTLAEAISIPDNWQHTGTTTGYAIHIGAQAGYSIVSEGGLNVLRQSTGLDALQVFRSGESYPRLSIRADGRMGFGTGAAALDYVYQFLQWAPIGSGENAIRAYSFWAEGYMGAGNKLWFGTPGVFDTSMGRVAAGRIATLENDAQLQLGVGLSTAPTMTGPGLLISNLTTAPSTNPVGGIVLYSEAGVLKARDPAGTITSIAPSAGGGALPSRLAAESVGVNIDTAALDNGFYEANGGTIPPGVSYAAVEMVNLDNTYGRQILYPHTSNDVWMRRRQDSVWQSWFKLPTGISLDIGAGSLDTALSNGNYFFNYAAPGSPLTSDYGGLVVDNIDAVSVRQEVWARQSGRTRFVRFTNSAGVWSTWQEQVPPYRVATGVVQLDDTLAFGNTDTNLYRSAAGVLKTDGIINAVGGLQTNGGLVLGGDTTLSRYSAGMFYAPKIRIASGNYLQLEDGSTLYFNSAGNTYMLSPVAGTILVNDKLAFANADTTVSRYAAGVLGTPAIRVLGKSAVDDEIQLTLQRPDIPARAMSFTPSSSVDGLGYTALIDTSQSELRLRSTGGALGTVALRIVNGTSGVGGAIFQNYGVDLIDFAFIPSSGRQRNIRLEGRASPDSFSGSTPEFQFGLGADPSVVINDTVLMLRKNGLLFGTDTNLYRYAANFLKTDGMLSALALGMRYGLDLAASGGVITTTAGFHRVTSFDLTAISTIYPTGQDGRLLFLKNVSGSTLAFTTGSNIDIASTQPNLTGTLWIFDAVIGKWSRIT